MRYAEDRELAIKIWKAEKHKAVVHFWELHGHRLSYMRIAPIPYSEQNTFLRCDHCSPTIATQYQAIPQRLLLCTSCAKRLKRYRYNKWRANQRWKDHSTLYQSQMKFNRIQATQPPK